MQSLQATRHTASKASRRHTPFSSSRNAKRVRLAVSAQETPTATEVQVKSPAAPVPVLEWKPDNEGLKELMGFAGSAPERTNGRAAMLGFAAAAAAELSTGLSVSEQFSDAAFSVILVNVLLGLGSIAPKFLSGTSLAELHEAAIGDNLVGNVQDWTSFLRFFDTNIELWTGRVAMIGVTGLVATEAIIGKALF